MASTTDRRIQAINQAIAKQTHDKEIDERTFNKEPFDGGYNRQRGRIIFALLFIILLGLLYVKYSKNRKK